MEPAARTSARTSAHTAAHTPAHTAALFPALLLLLALAGLDQTLLGTLLPTLARMLGHAELAPWVFTAYLTTATLTVPICGKLADRFGPRPVLLASTALFTLGSAACALATRMPMLVAARALQGLGGGALMTLALLTTVCLYPTAERARRMGMIGAAYSISTLVGPLIGGALVAHLPWQAAFLVNLPCAAFAWVVIRRSRFGRGAARPSPFDALGASLLAGALAAIVWATRHPLGSAQGMVAAVIALMLVGGWLAAARRAADPIVPLGLFNNPAFRQAAGLATLSGTVLFGTVVFLPLYLQLGLHLDALQSAWRTAPLMLGISLSAQLAGRGLRAGRSFGSMVFVAGLLMVAGEAALATLLRIGLTPAAQTWSLGAALLPIGLGLGLIFPLTSIIAQRQAPPTQLGAASALPVMLRSLGGALAVSLLGEWLHRSTAHAIAASAGATDAMAAALAIAFLWLAGAAGLSLWLGLRLRTAPNLAPQPAAAAASAVQVQVRGRGAA